LSTDLAHAYYDKAQERALRPWIRHRDLCGALDGGACSCGLTEARKEVARD